MFDTTYDYFAIALITILLGACAGTTSVDEPPSEPTGTLGTYTSGADGFHTHTYYFDTGSQVVVFDAQFTPDAARAAIDQIREDTDSPITHVVITHANPDKFNGASVFQKLGAKVVASESTVEAMPEVHAYKKHYFVNIAEQFTEDTYPERPQVDVTFEDELTISSAGGPEVVLHHLDYAATAPGHTVAEIDAVDALIVGDLVHHGVHAWLEGPIVEGAPQPDLDSWRNGLEALRRFDVATVHGGRGAAAPLGQAVDQQQAYLDEVERIVRDELGPGEEPTEELNAELAGRIIDAFPDYEHGYMVQYSIYGLTGSIASE
jgi:glyoxylase-like metal-dependent hydrolase (beta-lactamase superfamily II)